MAKKKLDSISIRDYANKFVRILRCADGPISRDDATMLLDLSSGQVSTLVKYMRRCALQDLERYIPYYPISSKQGYTLPHNYKDFLPCFATLYLWSHSLITTIEPMREKMEKEGIDIAAYIHDKLVSNSKESDNYLVEIPEMNADSSWFFDNSDEWED